MARLDIEEIFWIEIIGMAAKMGNQDQAIGNAIRFFRFAQQKHKAGLLVSEKEFEIEGFSEHLFPKFAQRMEGGIQAVGAQKHFKWLDQKVSAGQSGGQKSAQRPRDAMGRLLPKSKIDPSELQANSKHRPSIGQESAQRPRDAMGRLLPKSKIDPSELQAKPKHHQPSYPSATNTNTNTNTEYIAPAVAVAVENPVKFYCDAYKARYGHYPEIGGKQAGILQRFVKSHPRRFKELLAGYLAMPDSWAVQRSHPVELLETKVNEIVRFLETGKVVTRKVMERAEEAIDRSQGTNKTSLQAFDDALRERDAMLAEAGISRPMKLINGGNE